MDNHTTTARWSHEVEEKKSIIRKEKAKPEALNCPRCTSSHTKFCYYNNYNLSQPRYFCKTCRRYWTAGGSLRNVPVGGSSRKNKLLTSSSSYDHIIIMPPNPPPPNHHDDDDQPPSQNPSHHHHIIQNHGSSADHLQQHDQLHSPCSSMGFFKTSSSSGNDYATGMMMMNSFMPMPMPMPSSNPTMVCVYGFDQNDDDDDDDDENNINHQDHASRIDHDPSPSTGARLFFPLEDLKPSSTSHENHQLQGPPPADDSNSYWTGGGSW